MLKYTNAVKWTSTVSTKLVFDVGYGTSVNAYTEKFQPGIKQERYSPTWYTNVGRQDITRATTTGASTPETGTYNFRYMLISTMPYVTGSHALKAGMQWHIGQTWNMADTNGDLTERFRDGVPDSVIVYNTPTRLYNLMGADMGLYVQDSWTLKRLTINPGMRWEYFNSSDQAKAVEAGRFVPARSFDEIPNLPNWKNLAPRFSDGLRPDGRRQDRAQGQHQQIQSQLHDRFRQPLQPAGAAERHAQLVRLRLHSGHVDLLGRVAADQSGRHRAEQRDRAEQQQSVRPRAGAPSRSGHQTALRHRVQRSASRARCVDGVSVTGAWYRRDTYDIEQQTNLLVDVADYASFQTPNPLDGDDGHDLQPEQGQAGTGRSARHDRAPIARSRASTTTAWR